MHSYTEILKTAIAAKQHARTLIPKGSSALENNHLPVDYYEALATAVTAIRTYIQQESELPLNLLENNKDVIYYENLIAITSKYSLGNCYELALQALDYVLTKTPDIDAEVYAIKGGDHVFLVLNRDKDSNPAMPITWGSNAIICDPWANKVYNPLQYLSFLKTFSQFCDKNYLDDFSPDRHQLVPDGIYTTQHLRTIRTISNLKSHFKDEIKPAMNTLINYRNQLNKLKGRLSNQFGDSDEQTLALHNKINFIDLSIKSMNDNIAMLLKKQFHNDYREARSELNTALETILTNIVNIMPFSNRDKTILFHYRTCSEWLLSFCRKPKTHAELIKISDEVLVSLKAI